MASPPLLSKPLPGEVLLVYLAVSEKAASSILVREDEKVQRPVYYSSKAFQGAEERNTPLEKLALALVSSVRKLQPYFQGHPIRVPTSYPLRQVLQNPELSGRIARWAIELGEFDIEYIPRTAIKVQALAEFVVEFTGAPAPAPECSEKAANKPGDSSPTMGDQCSERWKLFVDGSSNSGGSGAGLVLVGPDQFKTCQALGFNFKASNNEAEYEAVIAGLGLARELGVQDIEVFSDSMLVVNQVTGEFQAKEERMSKYLEKVRGANL